MWIVIGAPWVQKISWAGPNDTEDPDLLVDRILVALGGTTCNPVEATGRRKAAPAINVLSHLL